MTRRKRMATLLLGLLAWSSSAWSASWLLAESKHFRLLAQTSKSMAETRLQDLERLHEAMLMALGATQGTARPPFPIVLSDDPELIGRVHPHLRDRHLAGLFVSGSDGAQAFAVHQSRAPDFTGQVLFHEYAHRLMAQYARMAYPVWYVEGFAEYFGATRITPGGVEIGAFNPSAEILGRRSWLSPERLLKPSFKSTGDKDVDDSSFGVFYAQSWLLTHYVLSKTERVQRFNDYFRRVAAGEDALATLEPATGIAPNRLNSELRRHLDNVYAAQIPAGAPAPVRITELPAEQAEAEFDGMVITARPEAGHGKAVLARLQERVRKAGGERAPDAMRWALAHAEIRYGDSERALEILAPWAQQDAAPFEANRLLGWAWQTQAAHANGADRTQALEQARSFLMTAYKQRRNDAPTLYQLARVLGVKGLSPSLINAADSASVLEPQVGEYVHFAVWAHLESGNRDRALRGLQSLASNPHGGEGTDRALAALQALQSNQDTAEVLALLNGMKKSTSP
jgi:tetratricopeptide (TPR) repeat protein